MLYVKFPIFQQKINIFNNFELYMYNKKKELFMENKKLWIVGVVVLIVILYFVFS